MLINIDDNSLKLGIGCFIVFTQDENKTKNNDYFIGFDTNTNNKIVYYKIEEKHLLANKLRKLGCKLLGFLTTLNESEYVMKFDTPNDEYLFNILEGIELSDYKFDKYFSETKKDDKNKIKKITFLVEDKTNFENKYKDFCLIKENVFLCRDLGNEPANVLYPESYSNLIKEFKKYGLEVEVLGETQMNHLGMNSLLAVGQGSDKESKLVVIKYNGNGEFKDPVAFVGKGITFDSGGIDIKPDNGMYDMKMDMCGSAVVVSTMKLLAQRKAKVNAVGVVALVENMPSGKATRPGDIVKSMSGQTVEILHTDAEGRLILADALYYTVSKFQPQLVVDLATLTGAICVALGEMKAGLFSNNQELANQLLDAGKETGEECWQMPLEEIGGDYDKMMDSLVADVKNISGGRLAGSITAAQFLQRFTDKHTKWCHLDIAGTAMPSSNLFFVKGKMASGFGVRLLNKLVEKYYEK